MRLCEFKMSVHTTYIVIISDTKPYLFEECEHPANHCGSLWIMPVTGGLVYTKAWNTHKIIVPTGSTKFSST